jgi:hypothetical protein
LYDAAIARGLDEELALDIARNQLGDPTQLLRAVRQYKENLMANFCRYILVPGLFAIVPTTLARNMLDVYRLDHNFTAKNFLSNGPYLWCFGPTSPRGIQEYFLSMDLPLLVAYLFAGSLAAFLCMHLGGNRRRRIWASLVPAAIPLALFFGALVRDILAFAANSLGVMPLDYLCWLLSEYLISSTVLPAIALLIGAAPFLTRRTEHPVACSRSVSTS